MQRMQWYLGSLLIGTALLLPAGLRAVSNFQQDKIQPTKLLDDDDKHRVRRYYDREHKDYHPWDDREDGAFRRWWVEERHETYRPFAKLKREEQSAYWKWRHEHPDNDRDRR